VRVVRSADGKDLEFVRVPGAEAGAREAEPAGVGG
jgi:hypothetical protein